MRLITFLAAVLLLCGGCDGHTSSTAKPVATSEQLPVFPDYIPTRIPPPDFDSKDNRILTPQELAAYPIGRYVAFPPHIAQLMQRADIENSWCKSFGDDPQTFKACNRRDLLTYSLEKQGYCWGSAKPIATAAEFTWLKCSQLPNFDPDAAIAVPGLFTDEEVAEVERNSAARGGLVPGQPYVPILLEPSHFDAHGKRIFSQAELARRPWQRYAALPAGLRKPMREADMERRLCGSGTGPDPERLRACNRRNILAKSIERFGFCSYFEARNRPTGQWLWRKCDADPEYDPRRAREPPFLHSEPEIAEAAGRARELAVRWAAIQRKR